MFLSLSAAHGSRTRVSGLEASAHDAMTMIKPTGAGRCQAHVLYRIATDNQARLNVKSDVEVVRFSRSGIKTLIAKYIYEGKVPPGSVTRVLQDILGVKAAEHTIYW